MENDPVAKKILDITLEIISLLTGEDYVLVKKFSDRITHNNSSRSSDVSSRNQNCSMEPPCHLLIHERHNEQKILELSSAIIQLLTGEAWEYLDGHKHMTESYPPFSPLDSSDLKDASSGVRAFGSLSLKKDKSPTVDTQETLGFAEEGQEDMKHSELSTQTQDRSSPIEKDLVSSGRENVPDRQTEGPSTPIKEESAACDEGSHTDPDLLSPTEPARAKCPLAHTKEGSAVSGDEENLSDSDTVTSMGYNHRVSAYIRDHNEPPSPESNHAFSKDHSTTKTYSCSECQECFSKSSDLAYHQEAHKGKSIVCSDCGKCFHFKSQLLRHQRTHTGEKPFSCPDCDKSFTQYSHFVLHKRTHTGEKPFLCAECGKDFISNSHLVRHKRTHTGEKPFECSDCGKCFNNKANLVKHNQIHTGEKPFSCYECSRCFTQKSDLVNHLRIHTGEKPYSCSLCGKCFGRKTTLYRHLRIHVGTKSVPFV